MRISKTSRLGNSDIGCLVVVTIIGLCMLVSWARKQPEMAAMVVGALATIWIAWNLWKTFRLSQAKRKAFESRYGAMLEKFEKDVAIVEESLKQTKAAADSVDRGLAEVERKLRSLS